MTHASISFVVGTFILALLVGVCVAGMVVPVLERHRWDLMWYGGVPWTTIPIAATVLLLVVCSVGLWALWPLDMEYHQWRRVSGPVAAVQARMMGDGSGGTTQQYAVRYVDGRQRRCDDTRCSLLRPGDDLTLWCIREWQWAAEDGYACRYGGRG